MGVIYKIQSKTSPHKFYIGSSVNMRKRKNSHIKALRDNKHGNAKLQHHYNKYGETDLIFSIVIECCDSDLIDHEQFFIDSLNPWFNICSKAGSCLGVKRTQEIRDMLSRAHIGIKMPPFTEEHKKNMSKAKSGKNHPMFGKKLSEEHKLKISMAEKGRKRTPMTKEGIERVIAAHKGKPLTDEHREKISRALKGVKKSPISEETRKKLKESHIGHKQSEETKAKRLASYLNTVSKRKQKNND